MPGLGGEVVEHLALLVGFEEGALGFLHEKLAVDELFQDVRGEHVELVGGELLAFGERGPLPFEHGVLQLSKADGHAADGGDGGADELARVHLRAGLSPLFGSRRRGRTRSFATPGPSARGGGSTTVGSSVGDCMRAVGGVSAGSGSPMVGRGTIGPPRGWAAVSRSGIVALPVAQPATIRPSIGRKNRWRSIGTPRLGRSSSKGEDRVS